MTNDSYDQAWRARRDHERLSEDQNDLVEDIVRELTRRAGEVDRHIQEAADRWALVRLSVTDRSVLAPMLRVGFRSMIGEARSLNVSFGFQHEENPKSSLEDSGNMFDVGVGMSMFRSHS